MEYNFKKSSAFTLAEVLITLAIIGVVASLTIPSVIVDTKKTQFEAAIKKTYNTLQNASLYSVMQNGAPRTWLSGVEVDEADLPEFLNKYIFPYLKISKQGTCAEVFDYTGYKNLNDEYINHTPFNNNDIETCDYAAQLQDGTVLGFGVSIYGDDAIFLITAMDLNGKKGPNKWGYDLFFDQLLIRNNGQLVTTWRFLRGVDKQAKSTDFDYCRLAGNCIDYLLDNSWKIDY